VIEHVLFVCTGNTCRSPMAEAVFRHMLAGSALAGQVSVSSAGTRACEGDPVTPAALAVLADHGIAHRGAARRVTPDLLRQVDLVVVMERRHQRAVESLLVQEDRRPACRLLLDFAPDLGLAEVPDPLGTDRYAETFQLIHAGAAGLLAWLMGQQAGDRDDSGSTQRRPGS